MRRWEDICGYNIYLGQLYNIPEFGLVYKTTKHLFKLLFSTLSQVSREAHLCEPNESNRLDDLLMVEATNQPSRG